MQLWAKCLFFFITLIIIAKEKALLRHFILLPWRQIAQCPCIIWMVYYCVAEMHACNKDVILNFNEPPFFSLPLLPCCSLLGPPGGSVWAEFRQHDHPPEEPHHDRRTEGKHRHAFIWIYHTCSLLDIERKCFCRCIVNKYMRVCVRTLSWTSWGKPSSC